MYDIFMKNVSDIITLKKYGKIFFFSCKENSDLRKRKIYLKQCKYIWIQLMYEPMIMDDHEFLKTPDLFN